MKLLILDNDLLYIKRFEKFFAKKYTEFQISIFDNIDDADYIIMNESFDIILFGENFDNIDLSKYQSRISKSGFAYFSSKDEIINETDTIFKYCSLSEIYKKICDIYEKNKNRTIRTSDDKEVLKTDETQVITFIPVHGGAGSSTMSAACAIYLAKDADVLYINLEQCPTGSVFFDNNSKKGLSDIIAGLKSRYTDSGFLKILKEVIHPDLKNTRYSAVNCINGYKNILDSVSMTPQIAENLINMLKDKFNYKYIIIDTDCIINSVMKQIIFQSDKLVLTSSGSDIANMKHKELKRYLGIISRENKVPQQYIIFNQYYGMKSDYSVISDMELTAKFPRYRSDSEGRLSSQAIIDEILHEDVFSKLK